MTYLELEERAEDFDMSIPAERKISKKRKQLLRNYEEHKISNIILSATEEALKEAVKQTIMESMNNQK